MCSHVHYPNHDSVSVVVFVTRVAGARVFPRPPPGADDVREVDVVSVQRRGVGPRALGLSK